MNVVAGFIEEASRVGYGCFGDNEVANGDDHNKIHIGNVPAAYLSLQPERVGACKPDCLMGIELDVTYHPSSKAPRIAWKGHILRMEGGVVNGWTPSNTLSPVQRGTNLASWIRYVVI